VDAAPLEPARLVATHATLAARASLPAALVVARVPIAMAEHAAEGWGVVTAARALHSLRDAQVARLQRELRDAQHEAAHYRAAFSGLWRLYAATRSERDALAAQLDCAIRRNIARVCDEGTPGGAA
jgi:hypothetical protein